MYSLARKSRRKTKSTRARKTGTTRKTGRTRKTKATRRTSTTKARRTPKTVPRKVSSPKTSEPIMQGDTITQLVIKDGRFSTLLGLVKMAGLADLLNDKSKTFTVFAPTDDAFAKLDEKTRKFLTSPQGAKKLKEILLYHVAPKRFESRDINGVSTVNTSLKDEILCVFVDNGEAKVNDATIVQKDVRASNGVIHAIDTVLAQPTKTCGKYGF